MDPSLFFLLADLSLIGRGGETATAADELFLFSESDLARALKQRTNLMRTSTSVTVIPMPASNVIASEWSRGLNPLRGLVLLLLFWWLSAAVLEWESHVFNGFVSSTSWPSNPDVEEDSDLWSAGGTKRTLCRLIVDLNLIDENERTYLWAWGWRCTAWTGRRCCSQLCRKEFQKRTCSVACTWGRIWWLLQQRISPPLFLMSYCRTIWKSRLLDQTQLRTWPSSPLQQRSHNPSFDPQYRMAQLSSQRKKREEMQKKRVGD